MTVKQRSWRRSNRALFLFSLLLVPTYLFSADASRSSGKAEDPSYGAAAAAADTGSHNSSSEDYDYSGSDSSDSTEDNSENFLFGFANPRTNTDRPTADILEDVTLKQSINIFGLVSNVLQEKIKGKRGSSASASKKEKRGRRGSASDSVDHYSDQELRLQNSILASAPPRVRLLHDTFKKRGEIFRGALFYGAPGGGKTRGARAVFRECGFKVYMVTPHECRAKRRGGTAKKFIRMLDALLKKKNVGILIDELHVLVGKPEQDSNDTQETSTAFHQWLEKLAELKRTDVAVICTANDIACLDRPLLNRFSNKMFKFEGPQTAEAKTSAFAVHFSFDGYNATARAEWDSKVAALYTKYPLLNGRDFETLSASLEEFRDVRIHESCQCSSPCRCQQKIVIDDIEQSMKNMMQERKDSKYYQDKETQQEQAERHFNEARRVTYADIGRGAATTIQTAGTVVQTAATMAEHGPRMVLAAKGLAGVVMGGM